MFRSHVARWIAGTLLFIAVLGVLRFKPWERGTAQAREQLAVGFLPVT